MSEQDRLNQQVVNQSSTRNEKRKALIIAVSDYDKLSESRQLPFCKNDGDEMYEVLLKHGYEIPSDFKLTDKVDGIEMKDRIIDFFSSAKSTDTLIFYFSGHGMPDGYGNYFLAASDIDPKRPQGRGYAFYELEQERNRCISKRIVTILDCCFSGAAESGTAKEGDEEGIANVARDRMKDTFKKGEGRCLLASSLGNQLSYKMHGKDYSIFTYYLKEGIEGADGKSVDSMGNVTASTLSNYLYEMVTAEGRQKPITKTELSGDILIAHHTNLVKPTINASPNIRVEDTYSIFSEGRADLKKGSFDKALQDFDRVLAIHPRNADAWYNKGLSLYQLQKYNEAIECYEKALQINPNDPDTWYGKGLSFAALEAQEDAISCYDKALEIDPGYKHALKAKEVSVASLKAEGSKYRIKGEYAKAIEYYNMALKGDPKNGFAWYNKGLSLYQLQRYEDAISCYDKALQINPRDSSSLYNKGLSLYQLQRYEDAISCYDKALEIYSKYAAAWDGKGLAYEKLGRHKEAQKCFSKARKYER